MSFRLGPVGPRGLAVLAVTAIVGVSLADHGWAASRQAGTAASLASGPRAAVASTPSPRAPSRSAGSAGRGTTGGSGGSAGAPGPSLASQSFAQYAFQIWPGTPTAAAKAALTGLTVSVRRQAGGLLVTASVNGQPAGSPHVYRGGERVYVVEAAMGDDSGASDYNLGDDGLVVTDAQGRIVS